MLAEAAPFQPFTIRMVGGAAYTVEHPDFIGFSRGGRTVVLFLEGEHIKLLDANLIAEADAVETPR